MHPVAVVVVPAVEMVHVVPPVIGIGYVVVALDVGLLGCKFLHCSLSFLRIP